MPTFGAKLQEQRGRLGMTQAGLAEAAGIPLGTIRDYEQDKRDPLASNLVKLARALGVSLDALAEGVEWAARRAPPARDIPTAAPRRRTGRKMPGKPGRRPRPG